MAKYLISRVETYRVDTEDEAQRLIDAAKADNSFALVKYASQHKELKETKNRDYDEWYRVTLTKAFDDEKEPTNPLVDLEEF